MVGITKLSRWYNLWQVTTKGTYVYINLKDLRFFYKRQLNKLSNDTTFINIFKTATFENIRKRGCLLLIIFFTIFNKLFRQIFQNKPGRHKVPFIVMCHICTLFFSRNTGFIKTYLQHKLFIYTVASNNLNNKRIAALAMSALYNLLARMSFP